jgi:hypothetical protein
VPTTYHCHILHCMHGDSYEEEHPQVHSVVLFTKSPVEPTQTEVPIILRKSSLNNLHKDYKFYRLNIFFIKIEGITLDS